LAEVLAMVIKLNKLHWQRGKWQQIDFQRADEG